MQMANENSQTSRLETIRQDYVKTGWDFKGFMLPSRFDFRNMVEWLEDEGLIEGQIWGTTFWDTGYILTMAGVLVTLCAIIEQKNYLKYKDLFLAA
jgi:hypothetical protein